MSGKHLLKLFSYANQNRNRYLNFSIKPFLSSRNGIKSLRSITTELSEPKASKDLAFLKPETASLYYWRYFMNNSYYSPYFNVPNINESDFQSIKLLSNLANVHIYTEENIKLSAEALNCLGKEITSYGVEELRQALLLTFGCKFFVPETNLNLEKMRKCIDEELCKRYFSPNETLKILNTLNVAQKSNIRQKNKPIYFVLKSSMKLLNKINQLSPQEIVLLFFCAPERNFSQFDAKYSILSYLSENISKFNADELGIIALGLFRLNFTFSYDKIFCSFAERILQEIENIHSVPFRSVCKVLQRFIKFSLVPNALEFQEQLIPHVSKLDSQSLLEAGLIGLKHNALNQSFKNILVNHLIESFKDLTLKGIARMLNVTVSFNIQNEALLIPVIKELEARIKESESIKQNEVSFINILKQLSHHQLYSEILLSKILSAETFNVVSSRDFPVVGKVSWWSLYCSISVEKPEYMNAQLNLSALRLFQKENKYLINMHGNRMELRNSFFNMGVIKKALVSLYGEDKVYQTFTLSHYESGLILRFNKKLEAQSIPEKFKFGQDHFNKKPLRDDHYWIFVMLLNFSDLLWETNTLKLSKQTHLRQLRLLGYVPAMVEFSKFKEGKADDGGQYIKTLVEETLRSLKQENMSN